MSAWMNEFVRSDGIDAIGWVRKIDRQNKST